MRTTNDHTKWKDTVEFWGDIPGGVRIMTPSGVLVDLVGLYGCNDKPEYDPKTGKEMFYPGWAEW